MKLQFNKNELVKAISLFQRVASNKTSSNLPGSIYISTKDTYVELQANDFEIGMRSQVDATIIEPGTIVVGSKYFQEILKKLPGEQVELYKPDNSNQLQIKSDHSEFKLVTMQVEDFSLVEQIQDDNSILIDGEQLKQLIDLTVYATSTDTDRPIFCGTLVEAEGNELTMVGTDTHRMAVKKVTLDTPTTTPMRIVIPKRTVEEVSRVLPSDQPVMVKLVWNRNQIAIMFDTVYIISRLIEGTYPDYKRVIPAKFDASAILNRREFGSSLDRVYFMAKDMSYSAIRYNWEENQVTLSSQSADIGMVKDIVVCSFEGNPFTINFNGKYIDELLKHSTGERIHMYLQEQGAMVIRQDNNDNYTYVVTPVHTHQS